MANQSCSIQELVSKLERGEIRLPEMQRSYVWKATKVRDLLDSLYREYPSGTILTWETHEGGNDESELIPTRGLAVPQEKTPLKTYQLLLDGQQRLTSLSAVIRGEPVYVRYRKTPIDILFNLEHPSELNIITEVDDEESDKEVADATEKERLSHIENMAFLVKSARFAQSPHWVSVTEVFQTDSNTKFLKEAGVSDLDDPRYTKYEQRLDNLRKIKSYKYDVCVLDREKSYEEVTEIFVRVNSLGVKLRGSDLALAQITAKWPGSLKIFEEFQEECKQAGFNLDLGIFVKNLVSFATGQCKFKIVSNLKREELENAWGISKKGFNFAMNFMKNNVGIDNPALLSSPFILIAIAYYARHKKCELSPEEGKKLRYWTLMANAKGRYSRGSSESYLDQDLRYIDEGYDMSKCLNVMIQALKTQFGRLVVQEEDLEGKDSRSAYFKTMFVVFKKDGAKDWFEELGISLNHSGAQHKLQFHHIYPQSQIKELVDKQKVNDICNLAFIGGKTNRKISNKKPSEYLPSIVDKKGEEALTLQKIPVDRTFWELDKYDDFLKARRKMVTSRLNDFLEHDSITFDGE